MNTPFKKRTDPFAEVKTAPEPEQKVVSEPVREVVVEKVVEVQKPKQKVVAVDDANREKYTATMDKALRKRVKLASIEAGVQVSTFIEQACLEKLAREGQ